MVSKLIEKAKNAREQLGDPALVLRCFSAEKETETITLAVQEEEDPSSCFKVDAFDEIFGPVNDVPGSEVKFFEKFRLLSDKDFAEQMMIELHLTPKLVDGAWVIQLDSNDILAEAVNRSCAPLRNELSLAKKKEVAFSYDQAIVNRRS